MAKQVSPQKSKSRFWMGCGIAVIVVLFLTLVTALVLFFLNSRNWQKEQALHVSILTPETGLLVEVQTPVELQATGTNPDGITRLELYADGTLISAQDSSEAQGENPLLLANIWTPITTGRHALLARGYSAANKFTDSNVIYIDVSEAKAKSLDVDSISHAEGAANPSLADIAAAYGVTPDELARLNPSISGTDPTIP
ncbi:MAG: Ig-like domain-containing protein, partial [Leptolinea sp.]